MKYFILTSSKDNFDATRIYLKYIFHIELVHLQVNPQVDEYNFNAEFNKIVSEIETESVNIRNSIIFVGRDLLRFERTNAKPYNEYSPLEENAHDRQQLVPLLILAFPEVHWVFIPSLFSENAKEDETFDDFHTYDNHIDDSKDSALKSFIKKIIRLNNTDLIALFDPCSLRNDLKQRIFEKEGRTPERKSCAAAIDDEISYSLMNAYTAYRFGYRAWIVASSYAMEHVFKNEENRITEVDLVFEDLYLNFPDGNQFGHLSRLEDRDAVFKGLENVKERILITVGHKVGNDRGNIWNGNVRYLKAKQYKYRSKILYKPIAGIFNLWKNAGKWKYFKDVPEVALNFNWPPCKASSLSPENSVHSAPGRLLLIADKLLDRSRRLLKTDESVVGAIHAATIALEAKELLACKTPTKSLEALSLQHQAEVEAESMFYGVEYDLDVSNRVKDLKNEIKAISVWFHPSSRKRSQLNAEITILSRLAQIYRKYSQFDEENDCLHEIRKLTNDLRANQNFIGILAWPIRAYINFLLQSLTKFAFVIVLWIFLFGFIYWKIVDNTTIIGELTFLDSVIVSAKTFLAFQPPSIDFWAYGAKFTPIELIWFIFPAVLGFVHLGVFISHLTIILMRKPGG